MMPTCYFHKATRSIADLNVIDSGEYLITRINVPSSSRGKGIGSIILDEICLDADENGVTLKLEVIPSGGLTFHDLTRWYERRGFKSDERKFGMLMTRLPNASDCNYIRGVSSPYIERAV